ncbi:MAG: hypothetical protein ABUS49_01325 [Acidobacteriota bacterium]
MTHRLYSRRDIARLAMAAGRGRAFRKMYEDASVRIYALKLGLTEAMSDEINTRSTW